MTQFSPTQIQALERFSENVELLEQSVRALTNELRDLRRLCHAQIHRLPRRESDLELAPEVIEPETLEGDEAFEAALAAFSDWYAVPGMATKAVHRIPGVLMIDGVSEAWQRALTERIEAINALKGELRRDHKAMGRPEKRHELIRSRFFMLQASQLMRGLTLFTCPPGIDSVTFTWGTKTEIKSTTVEEVCAHLEKLRPLKVAATVDELTWEEQVRRDQARLRSLSGGTELRWRRPLPIRPLANIRWHFSEAEKQARRAARERGEAVSSPTVLREAHTPIVLINAGPECRLGTLGIYDGPARLHRQQRKDRRCGREPVSSLVSVYDLNPEGGVASA